MRTDLIVIIAPFYGTMSAVVVTEGIRVRGRQRETVANIKVLVVSLFLNVCNVCQLMWKLPFVPQCKLYIN